MRAPIIAALLLASLTGCMHLPPDVAAVVQEADPPGLNNFRPEPAPEPAVAHAEPAAP